jgi:hypothetical protein
MQEAVNNPVFTIGCQMKYLNPIHLIKNYWKSKRKRDIKNETNKEIVGQVDAILMLPNGKLEAALIKRR